MSDHFDDLVGDVADPQERERLRRVHELLTTVEPPPELPAERVAPVPAPVAVLPQRRRWALALIAAALALAAVGSGYLLRAATEEPDIVRTVQMAATATAPGAAGSVQILPADEAGNWPMNLLVRGLEPSRDRDDFYELWLTKDGELADSCGRFLVHDGLTEVELTVPYGFKRYDGWVVTRRGSDKPLLST